MLSKTTAARLAANSIARCLVSRYGVTGLASEPNTIEWACSFLLGTDFGAKEPMPAEAVRGSLRVLNSIRVSQGVSPWHPPYGNPLFEAVKK